MKSNKIGDAEEYITQKGLENGSSLIPEGSILMVARSGILKRTIPVAITTEPVAINQDIRALIPTKENIHLRYIQLAVRGFRDILLNLWRSKGATVESLDSNEIASTQFPIPPLNRQAAIVEYVDKRLPSIDQLIENKKRLLDVLEEKIDSVVTQAVSRGVEDNVEMKDTGVEWIGSVPSHWKKLRIGSLIEEVKNPVDVRDDEEYQEIGIRSHGKGIFHKDPVTGEEIGGKKVFNVIQDTLIINKVFAWEGAVALTGESEQGMIASHRFPMYATRDVNTSLEYLKYFFTHGYGQGVLYWNSYGAAGRNRPLNKNSMLSENFWFPPSDEQQRIAEYISNIRSKINELIAYIERVVDSIKQKRQVFIMNAVTGQNNLSN
jgi:type I restriction enzyme S subunit